MTLTGPACTKKLCMCPGLYGNSSAVTMNNEVGLIVAVVSLGPQLLHSWLLKLTASPLSPSVFMSTSIYLTISGMDGMS